MPTATIRELLVAAYTEIGVLGEGTTMSAAQGTLGLAAVNRWIDALAADRLQMHAIIRETWPIISGTSTYVVSSVGSPTIVPPVFIDHVNFQDTSTTPTTEYPLTPLTDDAYAAIVLKTQTSSFPQCWWYNRDFPSSAIFLWPVPTSATLEGVMYAKVPVQEFANLSSSVLLPPGYQEMFVKNMAVRLAPSFQVQADPLLMQQAQESRMVVERSNKKLMDLSLDQAAILQGANRGGSVGHQNWPIEVTRALIDMLPDATVANHADEGLGDAASAADLGIRGAIQAPNLSDQIFAEFSHPVPATAHVVGPSLSVAVAHVVELRAKEEMVWIYTSTNVAAMENEEPVWYWAMRQPPGDTVGAFIFPVEQEAAIAGRRGAHRSSPQPTGISLSDVGPESICARLLLSHFAPQMQKGQGPAEATTSPTPLF